LISLLLRIRKWGQFHSGLPLFFEAYPWRSQAYPCASMLTGSQTLGSRLSRTTHNLQRLYIFIFSPLGFSMFSLYPIPQTLYPLLVLSAEGAYQPRSGSHPRHSRAYPWRSQAYPREACLPRENKKAVDFLALYVITGAF